KLSGLAPAFHSSDDSIANSKRKVERIEQDEPERKMLPDQPQAISFDQSDPARSLLSQSCATFMMHNGPRRVSCTPAHQTSPQPEFRVVGICEEVFVKAANFIKHAFSVKRGTAIGPKNVARLLKLTVIALAAAL